MTTAEVHLWGRRIGAVSIDRESSPAASFEYDGDFVDSGVGIEPAPLKMKRRRRIYSFPDDSPRTFRGLPGMLVDFLPDKFGTSLLDRWFAEQGKNPADINIVERLLYIADRGMGALSFQPSRNFPGDDESSALNINDLGYLADLVIRRDDSLEGELQDMGRSGAALDLIRVGTSAGGARAKAVLAETPDGEFLPGHRIYPVLRPPGLARGPRLRTAGPYGASTPSLPHRYGTALPARRVQYRGCESRRSFEELRLPYEPEGRMAACPGLRFHLCLRSVGNVDSGTPDIAERPHIRPFGGRSEGICPALQPNESGCPADHR